LNEYAEGSALITKRDGSVKVNRLKQSSKIYIDKGEIDNAIACDLGGVKIKGKVRMLFLWREKDKRRDPNNVDAAGKKLILDRMVEAGVLAGDGWAQLETPFCFFDCYTVDKARPGVTVYIWEEGDKGWDTVLSALDAVLKSL
jgi:hypothetical protein